jgi:hypothetical protein
MDIEGWEFEWLLQLTSDKLTKIKQIVIEVHGVNDDTWHFTQKDKINCFNKLNEQFYLIHIHGNTNSGKNNKIPDVLELTYLNKSEFDKEPDKNKQTLPNKELDFGNSSAEDYDLNFYPFVHK